MAQLLKRGTLGLGSGPGLGAVRLSPVAGPALSAESA